MEILVYIVCMLHVQTSLLVWHILCRWNVNSCSELGDEVTRLDVYTSLRCGRACLTHTHTQHTHTHTHTHPHTHTHTHTHPHTHTHTHHPTPPHPH